MLMLQLHKKMFNLINHMLNIHHFQHIFPVVARMITAITKQTQQNERGKKIQQML